MVCVPIYWEIYCACHVTFLIVQSPPTSELSKRVARLRLHYRFHPDRESDGASATPTGMRYSRQGDQDG